MIDLSILGGHSLQVAMSGPKEIEKSPRCQLPAQIGTLFAAAQTWIRQVPVSSRSWRLLNAGACTVSSFAAVSQYKHFRPLQIVSRPTLAGSKALEISCARVGPLVHVTGAHGEQSATRYSTLDTPARFDAVQVALRAVVDPRHANVPWMLP